MTTYLPITNPLAAQQSVSAQSTQHLGHSLEECEVDLQELFEDANYGRPLDPEDFSSDRGWWFRCRVCDASTRVRTRVPKCRHCGFAQKTNT